jgi:FkbM family methyltransferase
MNFSSLAFSFIGERLRGRAPISAIVGQIRDVAKKGKIAFYPCNRCSNDLLKLLGHEAPDVLDNVIGCFDKSAEAFTESGIPVYLLGELPRFSPTLAAIIVTSNVFFAKETLAVKSLLGITPPIVNISGIDLELAGLESQTLIAKIRAVYDLLADEKSRAVYLYSWLSRLLNDENMTHLFANDEVTNTGSKNDVTYYKEYKIDNLPDEIVTELNLNEYSMRDVKAAIGETILDIGAFKGDTAIYFADLVGASGKVYSFEPVSANYNDLVHNIRQNHLEGIVVPINKGCGQIPGNIRIATARQGSPWAFFSPDQGVEAIDVTSIDTFATEQQLAKIDFIKLDVEGMEYEVLKGGRRVISSFNPKMAISLYHNIIDLTEIPLLVNEMADYDLSIRCKMEGPWSIFLYCNPKMRC